MFAAADRSGLSLHAEALQTALAAHRLVMNIGENFALTGADKLRVVMLARQLEVLETNESIYLRARATPVASKRSVAKPSAAPPHY